MLQFDPRFDRVVVQISPDGTGCILTLTHELLPPDYHAVTEDGWGNMFRHPGCRPGFALFLKVQSPSHRFLAS
jgi:hypothetical protein